jgi:low affinity Fe/Cu permease
VTGLAFALTGSWASAVNTGALVFIVSSLLSMQAVQRRQAAALQDQLEELKRLLHVTEAVLDVEELEGAEEIDEITEARVPDLGRGRELRASLAARLSRLGVRLRGPR